jgi:aspartate kinase
MSGELRANSTLAMVLEMMGAPARSLTGREAGIVTRLGSGKFGPAVDALIQTVHEGYLLELVVQGIIPVVAGFQGYYSDPVSGRDEVSVLGRGGSNLTAVALADALGQADCTMFSDVDGVYDRDPRRFENAQRFDEVEASDLFAMDTFPNVIQQEAVAFAALRGVDIWIRSGFDPAAPGTKILCRGQWDRIPAEYRRKVTGEYVETEATEGPDTEG